MPHEKPVILERGEEYAEEIDTTKTERVIIIVNPLNSVEMNYKLTIEKLERGSFTEVPNSPIRRNKTFKEGFVTSSLGDRLRVTVKNESVGKRRVHLLYSSDRADDSVYDELEKYNDLSEPTQDPVYVDGKRIFIQEEEPAEAIENDVWIDIS